MGYRYYGGTREQSVEQDMADIRWFLKHGGREALMKNARGCKIMNISTLIICGLVGFGVLALIVWGVKNLIEAGVFNFIAVLCNPLAAIFLLPLFILGWVVLEVRR